MDDLRKMEKENWVDRLAQIKLRYIYATSWFNIVGMPLLVANLLQEKLLLMGIKLHFLLILFGGVTVIGIVGFFMDQIGLYESENTYAAKKNREIQEIKNNMRDNDGRTKK